MGTLSGTLVDPVQQRVFGATVIWSEETGRITSIVPLEDPPPGLILPGFVDAHVQVESSMLPPAEFARIAVRHGTLGAIADPHEIANVLGIRGIDWMIAQAKETPFVFGFGAPSCVPSTPFETSGAKLDSLAVTKLLARPEITHLSEVMNIPAVLNKDLEIMTKIAAAKDAGKPVDGHAPGLVGRELQQYADAGISTDHECLSLDDAKAKLAAGLFLQIRDGSAAFFQESQLYLLMAQANRCMFCSDDKHPDDLLRQHINHIAARAYRKGIPILAIAQAGCANPVQHYRLPLGLLQVGDTADFQLIERLDTFEPKQVWLRGQCVAQQSVSYLPRRPVTVINRLDAQPIAPADLRVPLPNPEATVRVINLQAGLLATTCTVEPAPGRNGQITADLDRDLLKIVVLCRYQPHAQPAIGLIRGFELKRGAIASSVSHDAHSIIAVGTSDESLAAAINQVILMKGGLAVADSNRKVIASLPLPVAGLISTDSAEVTARHYEDCDSMAKIFGSKLSAPFMTLSFLALPVIPEVKMTDRGLFDATVFKHVPLLVTPSSSTEISA